MIHRYLHSILTTGVTNITDDPTLLDDLFEANYGLEATEVDAVKEYWAEKPLNVVNGFARRDSDFPLIAITLASEQETQHFLGDSAGQEEDPEDEFYQYDIESAIWGHVYRLLIYTDHPDVTAWYYEIVKTILLSGLNILTGEGCFEYRMNGAELAPDPRYIPEHLYGRVLTFSCEREFQRVDRRSRIMKGFAVEGIHIDRSGSPNDVGGVKTLVVPYSEESNE